MRNSNSYCIRLFVLLILVSLPLRAQEKGSVPPAPAAEQGDAAALPPVEQALVPEGAFALQLAQALKLTQSDDESQAVKQLGDLGIEPKNGWIVEYPVTPDVIGDIDKAVAAAADSGKLQQGREQAMKALADVKTKLGLAVSTASAAPLAPTAEPKVVKVYKYTDKDGGVHITNEYNSIPAEYRNQATVMEYRVDIPASSGITPAADALAQDYTANPDQQVINNYYYASGPPAITYYPPPGPYYYLYTWTPYPFWCSGFFFRGFFVLRNFRRHIRIGNHLFAIGNDFNRNRGDSGRLQRRMDGEAIIRSNRMPATNRSFSPQIQQDARAILRLNSNRSATPAISAGPRVTPSRFPGTQRIQRQPPSTIITVPNWNRGLPQDFSPRMYMPRAFPDTIREFNYNAQPQFPIPQPVMPRSDFSSTFRRR